VIRKEKKRKEEETRRDRSKRANDNESAPNFPSLGRERNPEKAPVQFHCSLEATEWAAVNTQRAWHTAQTTLPTRRELTVYPYSLS
jgi:hypothetical protein